MFLHATTVLYDTVHGVWEKPSVSRRISAFLMIAFLGTGLAIVLNKLGLLPAPFSDAIPRNPFQAIRLAFSLILAVEVVELVFSIAESLSRAVAKQMEIMALILLRESFTDISMIDAPLILADDGFLLLQVALTALAGLLLFVFRGLFTKWYVSLAFNDNVLAYVTVKKGVALVLLLILVGAGLYDLYGVIILKRPTVFFEVFYSSLIVTDIFMLLVSQYFMPCFHATFRNSGYAVSTLIMRISLASPHYLGALLCIFAGLYLLALTWATSHFMPPERKKGGRNTPECLT